MTISAISRTMIKTGLQGLRLPLTAVERMSGHADSTTWPPAVAYESFEAQAMRILGSLIRDDSLVREGELRRAKVVELAEAERLETKADQQRMAADARLEERRESAGQARDRIEGQASQREEQLARDTADKQRRVREEARQREGAAQRANHDRQESVAAQERAAQKTRIAEESAALAKRSAALNARSKAQNLDDALDAKKAERKRS